MAAGPVLGTEVRETAAPVLMELTSHSYFLSASVLGLRVPSPPPVQPQIASFRQSIKEHEVPTMCKALL